MHDLPWDEFRRRCLKPDSDRIGTWTARRFARPVALRITRVVAPRGLGAHQATLLAAATALAAAVALSFGTPAAWLIGGLLLELWYVLDHVDGQLARGRGTASLDGTTLDYLMHHGVNLVVPQAVAFGLARQFGEPAWFWLGTAWSWGVVTMGLRHDARYKAFIQRLKVLHGELNVVGGGGGRRTAAAWPARSLRAWAAWCLKKSCEMHALGHGITLVGLAVLAWPAQATKIQILATALPALSAVIMAGYYVRRSVVRGEAEAEFAAWYRVPDEATLEFRDGAWVVDADPQSATASRTPSTQAACARTS